MANKMSEKKKSASRSETEEPKERVGEKELKSTKTSARETEESKERVREKESKSAKAATRDERPSRPVRRETRSAPASSRKSGGFRNWAVVRFVREAYHELRYKVTWPTFPEARNMTLVVIALSTIVGLVLGLVDAGLFQLFRLVTGK